MVHVWRAVQLFWWTIAVLFALPGWILGRFRAAELAIMRHLYYPACVRRRRAAGQPEWQEHDLYLGIEPPKDHPYWERLTPLPPGTVLTSDDHFNEDDAA